MKKSRTIPIARIARIVIIERYLCDPLPFGDRMNSEMRRFFL